MLLRCDRIVVCRDLDAAILLKEVLDLLEDGGIEDEEVEDRVEKVEQLHLDVDDSNVDSE